MSIFTARGRRDTLGPPAVMGIPFNGQHRTQPMSFCTSPGGVIQVSGWNVKTGVTVLFSAPTYVVPSPRSETVAAS